MNLASGTVVSVGKGKNSDALLPFWRRLNSSCGTQIEAVGIDIPPAYISAAIEHKPKVTSSSTIFMSSSFSKINSTGSGVRWITNLRPPTKRSSKERAVCFKNHENLVDERIDPERIEEAFKLN